MRLARARRMWPRAVHTARLVLIELERAAGLLLIDHITGMIVNLSSAAHST